MGVGGVGGGETEGVVKSVSAVSHGRGGREMGGGGGGGVRIMHAWKQNHNHNPVWRVGC